MGKMSDNRDNNTQGITAQEGMVSLHNALLKTLAEQLKDPDVKPALLNVARQFLKDNNINCDGQENPEFGEILKLLPDIPDEGAL
jgi:hypothetical protein